MKQREILFKKISKIGKPLTRLFKKKKKKTQINKRKRKEKLQLISQKFKNH